MSESDSVDKENPETNGAEGDTPEIKYEEPSAEEGDWGEDVDEEVKDLSLEEMLAEVKQEAAAHYNH